MKLPVFYFFCFSIYKLVSIGTITINPEILKFVPNHLKTKMMCKHTGKKFRFITR